MICQCGRKGAGSDRRTLDAAEVCRNVEYGIFPSDQFRKETGGCKRMAIISVIIPVYNAEHYLRRCLDSLIAQTFSDFDAILVDDGSADQSGTICEEYANKDSRFIVFHQKNQGQATARNFALDWVYDNRDSAYICFVDSDDWVHPRYLELLYLAAKEYGVNITQCLHQETDGSLSAQTVGTKTMRITAQEEYIHWYSAFFWEKLFSRACLEHVRFPEGQIYEDVAIWYKVLFAEKELALVQEVLYYYYINPISTVRKDWKPARLAQVEAWEDQLAFIQSHCSDVVLFEALRRFSNVFKTQLSGIQSSNAITEKDRGKYSRLLRQRLKRFLRNQEDNLKKAHLYSDLYSLAHPIRIRLYGMMTLLKSPKKVLNCCKNTVLKCLSKPTILFESIPDFSDNTRAVYDELLRRGLDRRYYLIWDGQSGELMLLDRDGKITSISSQMRGLSRRIRLWSVSNRTAAIVCCNRVHFSVDTEKAIVFYLSHGTPIKSLHETYFVPAYIDHALAASEAVIPISANEFNINVNKFVALGFPRNDVFAQPPFEIREMLQTGCSNVIVWYPTYRQHKNGVKTGSNHALPILHDREAARRLDRAAAACDTLVVLKPHFAQDVSLISDLDLQNIRLIDDNFFRDHNITSYQFVNSCSALITDYSSIYYDYLLADKPIAVTWDDLEDYRRDPGFAVDLDVFMKGAVKAYNVEELITFIQDVASGRDTLKAERCEIRDIVNYSTDGKNTERVADYIIKQLNVQISRVSGK